MAIGLAQSLCWCLKYSVTMFSSSVFPPAPAPPAVPAVAVSFLELGVFFYKWIKFAIRFIYMDTKSVKSSGSVLDRNGQDERHIMSYG